MASERQDEQENAKSDDEIEKEISKLEFSLPEELQARFDDANQNVPMLERYRKLKELVDRRKEALIDELPRNVEVTKKLSDEFVERMQERLRGAKELGRGENGRVVADPVNERMAYKFLTRPPIPPQNSLIHEAGMQGRFYEIADKYKKLGVGVPRLEYFSTDPQLTLIAMERLDAVSVRDILDGVEQLPMNADIDKLFTKLNSFLKVANETEGLFHLDVGAGNVMIHRNQVNNDSHSNVYLIDMGMSKLRREVKSVTLVEHGVFIQKVDKVSDCSSVEAVRRRLKSFLQ